MAGLQRYHVISIRADNHAATVEVAATKERHAIYGGGQRGRNSRRRVMWLMVQVRSWRIPTPAIKQAVVEELCKEEMVRATRTADNIPAPRRGVTTSVPQLAQASRVCRQQIQPGTRGPCEGSIADTGAVAATDALMCPIWTGLCGIAWVQVRQ